MARQGKLHSSPFHVESPRYILAVEKENADYQLKQEIPDCSHYDLSRKLCRLWNSGNKLCAPYKCRYNNETAQRSASCEDCAFYYEQYCYHVKGPKKDKVALSSARHCCFYVDEEGDKEKYWSIQNGLRSRSVQQQYDNLKSSIKRWEKLIADLQEKKRSPTISLKDKSYYENKIYDREQRIRNANEQLEVLRNTYGIQDAQSDRSKPQSISHSRKKNRGNLK